jgi:hypothetical protein
MQALVGVDEHDAKQALGLCKGATENVAVVVQVLVANLV